MNTIKLGFGFQPTKKKIFACFSAMDESGKVSIKSTSSFDNESKGLDSLIKWAEGHTKHFLLSDFVFDITNPYCHKLVMELHRIATHYNLMPKKVGQILLETIPMRKEGDKAIAEIYAHLACISQNKEWDTEKQEFVIIDVMKKRSEKESEEILVFEQIISALKSGPIEQHTKIKKMEATLDALRGIYAQIGSEIENKISENPGFKAYLENPTPIDGLMFFHKLP